MALTTTTALAQTVAELDADADVRRPVVNLSSNILTDVLTFPSLGIEVGVGPRLSFVLNTTYGWREGWPWHENIRIGMATLEGRWWLTRRTAMSRGWHVGAYGGAWRYDFYFGSQGQQAKINWTAGVAVGYMLPVGRNVAFDFTLGIGFLGGKYRKYEYIDDEWEHFVWKGDFQRAFFGPTRAEVSFVWNIGGGAVRQKGDGK